MTPQEQLCEKMRVEQSAYCLWLTAQPPEEILHHAYEYSVREDIILATEEMNLTPARVRALLKSPAPLADVYKDFSKLETDYHPNVKYTPDAGGEPYVMPPDYMGDAVTITMGAVAAATAPEITEEMYEQLDYLEKHPEENYYENEENFSQYDQGD